MDYEKLLDCAVIGSTMVLTVQIAFPIIYPLYSDKQEVAGSTPAGSSSILSWRLIMKYFLLSFSPFC